ncbi:BrnT family toxin [Aerosakkonema sp. BLCC-F183]|uniref:BrnT family toxin n=1 Tax=Aerosakkonema sp. BLCC-F183 TaxID=3342834 RepID=UPI0035BC4BDD
MTFRLLSVYTENMDFKWDAKKERTNQQKHRVSFEEVATVWTDTLALIAPDPEHSIEEEREWIIGESYKGRLLVVVYTQKEETIRIISARLATKRERQQYAEEN